MGDHFVLFVDRLITESTLEAVIESTYQLQHPTPTTIQDIMESSHQIDMNTLSSPSKFVQCRICHDEDDDSNMEAPCSCCGSLKKEQDDTFEDCVGSSGGDLWEKVCFWSSLWASYAHRKCVQKWCNEKGDTICEICHQQFKPDYTAPPPLYHYSGIPMNFRGNWEISRRDLQNPGFIAMVTTDHGYLDTDFADEYSAPSSRSLLCCRIVAIIVLSLSLSHTHTHIHTKQVETCEYPLSKSFNKKKYAMMAEKELEEGFMVLLVLRHTLPILLSGAGEYSLTLFTLMVLRTIGILFPIYIMVRVFTVIQRRRHQQDPQISPATSDEENDFAYPSRFIQIR
ncbi:hypothetical protein C1H46_024783 [Malus baccata]|uniref:RING-CH-type domain-containing protein n=1 Tax=Malus baccata TaxID=106549 RepID=A0A540LTB7_MALBA|nr:hypothetical protein C1H46_024783 [Malus baccata]